MRRCYWVKTNAITKPKELFLRVDAFKMVQSEIKYTRMPLKNK